MVARVCIVKNIGGRLRAVDRGGKGQALDVDGLPVEGSWIALHPKGAFELLAQGGTRLADLVQMVVGEHVAPIHTDSVNQLAESRATDLQLEGLVDLSRLPFVPIDEVTSRDLDQALAIERRGEGYVVWYALADAAWFVRPGDALYEDAIARGATYYLPGWVVPMLPRILSEDAISLNAGVDRRAMVFELTLDAEGRCVDRSVHRARIHCRHKLDFHGVQRFLDGEKVAWDADVQASLRLLPVVGGLRITLAEERGVVHYRRTEVDVHLEGLRFVAMEGPRNDVERYNEQISLLTNIQGALLLLDDAENAPQVQPIYRVHEAPSEQRYVELAALAHEVVQVHGLEHEPWSWDPEKKSLADYLEGLPTGPIAAALHRQAMIINRPSHFAATPGVHFGVGAEVYGRFTAPMREVVGVFSHHEVWEKLGVVPPDPAHGDALRERVVKVSNRARERQRKFNREVNRLVLDDLFGEGESRALKWTGVVLGMTPTQIHVQLDEPRVDVKVYRAHLEEWLGTSLTINAASVTSLSGEVLLRLGDRVRLWSLGRDERRDRWILAVQALPTRQR